MNTYVRFAMCLAFHAAGCVAYAFLNDAVVVAYKAFNGGFTTRGVGIGIAHYMFIYIFFGVNLVVALFPNLWAKLGVLAVMVSWILFTMVPDNPLRALFYTVAQGGVTLLAILVTQVIELRWTQRAFIHRVGQSPSTGVRD
ncbi:MULTISPECIES: hypothetical protein [Gammaproteobacteria]|uniref:hypothetical protein n=1 Tax=Gammaproteobacteria TaxID=1236 RepID=UPI0019148DF5|nr:MULTISPECIES: hypothetical protein [Gammaproteobacteria]MBK5302640.1 hypothetical protein [Bacillus sp. TH86]MBK5322409.1 hypothetical protein [Bacillus sp. TH59]MBK5337359.1 hypothetical protein [Bacillus sp. TH57]MBK5311417.1 hypothetical protein [Pseudomonas sp. TH71]MBK5316906.1 hypothetical protein [Erwinia sp. TH79]